ncbi:MAG: lysophospholipid acyltransferase family protein [Ignavibacteriales bacterium]|nr:MAG: lysophospholipid acyltransferase family protein [Ignavibacteriales bacterium]
MKNRLEYILFRSLSRLFCFAGLGFARKFSHVIALLFYYVIPIRKSVVKKNLAIAFPDASPEERERIAFGSYKSFARSLVEILMMPELTEESVKKLVASDSVGMIRQKFEEGKGVILLTAHYGNWEYSALAIGIYTGIPLYVVTKSQRNPFVNDWMNRYRAKFGNVIVPLGASIKLVFKQLYDKKVIAMVADQRGPSDGIKMDFMGRETRVYAGPASLSIKTGAPILMGFIERQPDDSYRMEFQEISKEGLPENFDAATAELTRRHISILEDQLRKKPEDWLWMHNRWKY